MTNIIQKLQKLTNHTLYLLLAVAVLVAAFVTVGSILKNPAGAQNLPDLVSRWSAENNAIDSIDGNHGTLQGSMGFATGKVGQQAFSFDGVDDYVLINDNINLHLDDFTVGAWVFVNAAENTGERRIVSKDNYLGAGTRKLFTLGSSSSFAGAEGRPTFGVGICADHNPIATNPCLAYAVAPTPLTTGWHHLAGVRLGGTVKLYVDGVDVASAASSVLGTIDSTTSLTLGNVSSPGLVGQYFKGLADEVELYNRALSASEIQSLVTASCVALPAGLVGWWPGDGNANDIWDGNQGTLMNGTTFAAGKVGQAFSFDGVDDDVFVPHASNLDIHAGDFSIDLWARFDDSSKESYLLMKGSQQTSYYQIRRRSNGQLRFVASSNGDTNADYYDTATTFSASPNLYHIAATYQKSSRTMKVYINGVEEGQLTNHLGSAPSVSGTVGLHIGSDLAVDGFFKGLIDEVAIFNRALTAAEIQAIFNAGSAGMCKVPPPPPVCVAPPTGISWWPGDGNANDIIDANPGTLVGATFTAGKVGQAFSFDGVDDFVSIPDSASLRPANLTVGTWAKIDALPDGIAVHLVDKNTLEPGFAGYEGYLLGANGPAGFLVVTTNGYFTVTGNTNIVDGQPHFLVGTYDGTSVKIYVDGVLQASTPASGSMVYSNSLPLVLGANHQPSPYPRKLKGFLDEVEIYSAALTQQQIQAIYNAGSAGMCKVPPPPPVCVAPPTGISWWPGDGNANDIQDGNHGIITTEFSGTVSFPSGKVGQEFHFNGANFVEVPPIPLGEFTIDVWLNPATYGLVPDFGRVIASNEVCGLVADWHFGLEPDGRLVFRMGPQDFILKSTGIIPLNVFTHVVVVRDLNSKLQFYINGALDSTHTTPHNGIVGASDPACDGSIHQNKIGIGNLRRQAVLGGDGAAFKGSIDEVEVFNRALTSAEIQSIFNAGSAGKCKDTPFINTASLTDGGVGQVYSQTLAASLGTPPYTFSLASGALPPGMSLSAAGVVSGIPTSAGTFTFAIKVTDSVGKFSQKDFSIVVKTCTLPPTGLVGWWPGEGNANDIIGISHGTLSGVVFAPGKVGQAFSFDSASDVITVSPVVDLGSAWTIDAWFTAPLPSTGTWHTLTRGSALDHQIIASAGLQLGSYDNAANVFRDSGYNLGGLSSGWHHIAAVGSGGSTTFYVDGVAVGTIPFQSTSDVYAIGNYQGGGQWFANLVDEVEVYNTALLQAQIQAIYNAGSAGKCKVAAPVADNDNIADGVDTQPGVFSNESVKSTANLTVISRTNLGNLDVVKTHPTDANTLRVELAAVGADGINPQALGFFKCNDSLKLFEVTGPATAGVTCPGNLIVDLGLRGKVRFSGGSTMDGLALTGDDVTITPEEKDGEKTGNLLFSAPKDSSFNGDSVVGGFTVTEAPLDKPVRGVILPNGVFGIYLGTGQEVSIHSDGPDFTKDTPDDIDIKVTGPAVKISVGTSIVVVPSEGTVITTPTNIFTFGKVTGVTVTITGDKITVTTSANGGGSFTDRSSGGATVTVELGPGTSWTKIVKKRASGMGNRDMIMTADAGLVSVSCTSGPDFVTVNGVTFPGDKCFIGKKEHVSLVNGALVPALAPVNVKLIGLDGNPTLVTSGLTETAAFSSWTLDGVVGTGQANALILAPTGTKWDGNGLLGGNKACGAQSLMQGVVNALKVFLGSDGQQSCAPLATFVNQSLVFNSATKIVSDTGTLNAQGSVKLEVRRDNVSGELLGSVTTPTALTSPFTYTTSVNLSTANPFPTTIYVTKTALNTENVASEVRTFTLSTQFTSASGETPTLPTGEGGSFTGGEITLSNPGATSNPAGVPNWTPTAAISSCEQAGGAVNIALTLTSAQANSYCGPNNGCKIVKNGTTELITTRTVNPNGSVSYSAADPTCVSGNTYTLKGGDTDQDGIANNLDNSPLNFNPDQLDSDGDGTGDVSDGANGVNAYNFCSATGQCQATVSNAIGAFTVQTNNATFSGTTGANRTVTMGEDPSGVGSTVTITGAGQAQILEKEVITSSTNNVAGTKKVTVTTTKQLNVNNTKIQQTKNDGTTITLQASSIVSLGGNKWEITFAINGLSTFTVFTALDTDGDGVYDQFDLNGDGDFTDLNESDSCATVVGNPNYQGCPVADKNLVTLHTVNLGGGASTKAPLAGAPVRVFDRNSPDFQAVVDAIDGITPSTLGNLKNPDGSLYGALYEADMGRVGSCATGSDGTCLAGEAKTGDYLVIVKYVDSSTGKTVYTGRPKSPTDFVDTNADGLPDLATKDLQIIKVSKNGVFQGYRGGSKIVVTGSMLEVIAPESAIWEGNMSLYPFIFTSDSNWTVDTCTQVPTGYSIVGAYDEMGNLVSNTPCAQALVANTSKVIAFEVTKVGSPEPSMDIDLTVKNPKGKVSKHTLKVSDIRRNTFDNQVKEAKAKAGELKKKRKLSQDESLWDLVVSYLNGSLQVGIIKSAVVKVAQYNGINIPEWGLNNGKVDAKRLLPGLLIDLTPLDEYLKKNRE